MLCSDGLCGYCTDEEIERSMRANDGDVDDCCKALMKMAMDAGGQDNITVLVASFVNDEDDNAAKPKVSFFKRLFG